MFILKHVNLFSFLEKLYFF